MLILLHVSFSSCTFALWNVTNLIQYSFCHWNLDHHEFDHMIKNIFAPCRMNPFNREQIWCSSNVGHRWWVLQERNWKILQKGWKFFFDGCSTRTFLCLHGFFLTNGLKSCGMNEVLRKWTLYGMLLSTEAAGKGLSIDSVTPELFCICRSPSLGPCELSLWISMTLEDPPHLNGWFLFQSEIQFVPLHSPSSKPGI